jgi:hypothetical protein
VRRPVVIVGLAFDILFNLKAFLTKGQKGLTCFRGNKYGGGKTGLLQPTDQFVLSRYEFRRLSPARVAALEKVASPVCDNDPVVVYEPALDSPGAS